MTQDAKQWVAIAWTVTTLVLRNVDRISENNWSSVLGGGIVALGAKILEDYFCFACVVRSLRKDDGMTSNFQ